MRQASLFLAVGGIAALANVLSRMAFSTFLPYWAAIVLAYIVGMITAFTLNRLFVFTDASNALHEQAAWFIAINIAAVLQTLLISILLARWLLPNLGVTWHPDVLAHVAGVIFPVFTSYFGHKHLSFRSSRDAGGHIR